MRHPARPLAAAAVTLAAAFFAACSEGGKDPVEPDPTDGEFGKSSLQTSGGVSVSADGVAMYASSGPLAAEGGGFALVMGSLTRDSAFENYVAISRVGAGTPGPGTYAFYDALSASDAGPDAFTLGAVLGAVGGRQVVCIASAGTLTVSSAGGGRLKGSYNARAACFDDRGAEQAETTISGTFDAVDVADRTGLPRAARLSDRVRAARLARAPR